MTKNKDTSHDTRHQETAAPSSTPASDSDAVTLDIELAAFWPMPFRSQAVVALVTDTDATSTVHNLTWSILYDPAPHPITSTTPYFHATYTDHPTPTPGHDVILLDTHGIEGEPEWSGHLVGTTVVFSHHGVLNTLEGDPRFYFDESETPQVR